MRIGVLTHIQPIFATINAYGCIQVSTLELAIKGHIFSPEITVLPFGVAVAVQAQVCLL